MTHGEPQDRGGEHVCKTRFGIRRPKSACDIDPHRCMGFAALSGSECHLRAFLEGTHDGIRLVPGKVSKESVGTIEDHDTQFARFGRRQLRK